MTHLEQSTGINPQLAVTYCVGAYNCVVGFLKWFEVAAIPEIMVWGGFVLLIWQLVRMFRSSRRDRSQDGTNY